MNDDPVEELCDSTDPWGIPKISGLVASTELVGEVVILDTDTDVSMDGCCGGGGVFCGWLVGCSCHIIGLR